MSQQYRSLIKDCQEQLEHLAAQSSHYLAQVFRFTFIVVFFYRVHFLTGPSKIFLRASG